MRDLLDQVRVGRNEQVLVLEIRRPGCGQGQLNTGGTHVRDGVTGNDGETGAVHAQARARVQVLSLRLNGGQGLRRLLGETRQPQLDRTRNDGRGHHPRLQLRLPVGVLVGERVLELYLVRHVAADQKKVLN